MCCSVLGFLGAQLFAGCPWQPAQTPPERHHAGFVTRLQFCDEAKMIFFFFLALRGQTYHAHNCERKSVSLIHTWAACISRI